jgi:transcriptional regulator with XRE-family HTH domain
MALDDYSARPMSLSSIVAKNLLALRRKQNLTQTALAKKTGLSVSYISMLERGQRSPPLDTIEVLAKVLKLPAASILEKGTGSR